MADNSKIFPPGYRILDSNGDPVSGAALTFYDAGTSNLRTVYSDNDLTVSLGTTVTCNSAGEPSSDGTTVVSVYTGTTDYKVIIKDSTGVTLGTYDNQTGALDTSSFASDQAIPIRAVISKAANYTILTTDQGDVVDTDPSGANVTLTLPDATTAGDDWLITCKHTGTGNIVTISGTGGDTIDGQTSIILTRQYHTVTIVSDGANWHVLNDYRPSEVALPQGRLCLASGTPIITADDTGNTSVFYTPYVGDIVPVYDGSRFVPWEFTELTLTLDSTVPRHAANTAYDVFVFINSGDVTIATGPAWTNSGAGSGDRTASALTRTKGILTNNASITAYNSTTSYTIAANRGTYLGSILIDASNGQVSCEVGFGQTRRWAIWNAYNRMPIIMKAGDATASWSYTTGTVRASNNDSSNKIAVFCGLAEEFIDIAFRQGMQTVNNSAQRIGIGWNSTSSESGQVGIGTTGDTTASSRMTPAAAHIQAPALGLNNVQALEFGGGGTGTMFGGNDDMQLVVRYNG